MSKIVQVNDSGFVWEFPLSVIADNRAKFYAERDKDTTYQEEFDYVMADDYEGLDWFLNNMDWSDVAASAELVEIPARLAEPRINSSGVTTDVIERAA